MTATAEIDLEGDPEEVHNLFDAPETAGVRRELEGLPARRTDDMGQIRAPVGIA